MIMRRCAAARNSAKLRAARQRGVIIFAGSQGVANGQPDSRKALKYAALCQGDHSPPRSTTNSSLGTHTNAGPSLANAAAESFRLPPQVNGLTGPRALKRIDGFASIGAVRKWICAAAVVALSIVFAVSAHEAAAAGPVRVMPLGDSITGSPG